MEEVLTLLKDDQSQRTHQIERQVDSARYLNELNTVSNYLQSSIQRKNLTVLFSGWKPSLIMAHLRSKLLSLESNSYAKN